MKNNTIEIFLFIDALGWKIVKNHQFLTDILPYRKKVDMQFGYSSSAIPSILSGKTPAEHGHLGLFRFAPEVSPFKKLSRLAWLFKPASFWNRGRVRHHLSKLITFGSSPNIMARMLNISSSVTPIESRYCSALSARVAPS